MQFMLSNCTVIYTSPTSTMLQRVPASLMSWQLMHHLLQKQLIHHILHPYLSPVHFLRLSHSPSLRFLARSSSAELQGQQRGGPDV